MKVLHQTGFRFSWNVESFSARSIGDGLIFSPVNINSGDLERVNISIKNQSFFDPQIYLPNQNKGTLGTYDYHPSNFVANFETQDFNQYYSDLSDKCVKFQIDNGFKYIVIPVRYFDENPSNFFSQHIECFVNNFCNAKNKYNSDKELVMTVIIKQSTVLDEEKRFDFLNWVTSVQDVNGLYLIFENNFFTKQIKDTDYLYNVLIIIDVLKNSGFDIYIGYNNVEGLLYSAANPDSVAVGAYENLRSFKKERFVDAEKGPVRGPNARLYSGKLHQWIDTNYLSSIARFIPNYTDLFEDTIYKNAMFNSSKTYNWHFTKAEPYKHYFEVFYQQVQQLPDDQFDRIEYLKSSFQASINLFKEITKNVLLDDNSNESHLYIWVNVLNMYKQYLIDKL